MPELDDLLAVPFVERGRDPATGLDCYGLLMEVFRRFGVDVDDYRDYAIASAGEIAESMGWHLVPAGQHGAPLAILMQGFVSSELHVGVYIGDGRVIHTGEKTGVVIEKVRKMQRVTIGLYRWGA